MGVKSYENAVTKSIKATLTVGDDISSIGEGYCPYFGVKIRYESKCR